jgi:hypothetical protein
MIESVGPPSWRNTLYDGQPNTCKSYLPILNFGYAEYGPEEKVFSAKGNALYLMAGALVYYGESVNKKWPYDYAVYKQSGWGRFVATQNYNPGQAGCGTTNGLFYGDYTNDASGWFRFSDTRMQSNACDDFLHYPNLTGTMKAQNCTAWGCTELGAMQWYLSHVPSVAGKDATGKWMNFWKYLVWWY